jgi:hypothetical protein
MELVTSGDRAHGTVSRRPTCATPPLALSLREAERNSPYFHFPLPTLALSFTLLRSPPPATWLTIERHHRPSQSPSKPSNQFAVFSSMRCMSFGLSHRPTTPGEAMIRPAVSSVCTHHRLPSSLHVWSRHHFEEDRVGL